MNTTDTSDSILIVLDVPTGVEFGIDCITYETGPKFKGLSLVPSGLHFVYHGTGMGARQGFFIMVGSKDILVKRWDSSQEEILPRHDLSEESLRGLHHALAVGELNAFLGPYPLQQHHTWRNITNFISLDVLNRADCSLCSLIYPGDDSDVLVLERTPAQSSRSKGNTITEAVKPYFPDSARIARFSDLQMIEMELIESLPQGAKRASTITSMMMDKSVLVEHMITHIHEGSWAQFLGEIQLSFVLFMVLYSYPALKQWKLLIYSVCSSERLLQQNQPFTAAFMRMLFAQLNFAPADFFENELSTQNFLRPTITALFSALSGPNLNPTLLEHKKRLRTFLQKKFNLHETEPFESVDASTGMQVAYEEEDLYNIAEEDLPTFVSEEEVQSYYLGGAATLPRDGAEMDTEALDDMRLDAREGSHVFNVRDRLPAGTNTSNSRTADADGNNQAFHQRWASIDSALVQAPGGEKLTEQGQGQGQSAGSAGRIGEELFLPDRLGQFPTPQFPSQQGQTRDQDNASSESKIGVERDSQDSRNFTFGSPNRATADNAAMDTQPQPLTAMSPAEKEAGLFSWRYPLVYESMVLSQGREDMVMAAMRILEEGNIAASGESMAAGDIALGLTAPSGDISAMRYKEAERFVEYELGSRN